MRTKAQIAKILYDNLSDSRWSKLRDALNGAELIAIATDVVYLYEQRYRNLSSAPDAQSRETIRETLEAYIPAYIPRGSVYDALLAWGVECVYQVEQAILKDYKDTDWTTATSYAALLNLASKPECQFPVIDRKPAYIIVQIPSGDETFPPYSISIQAGSAVFTNIIAYSSGDQATLFQGVPYSYNHSKDISGLAACQAYDASIKSIGNNSDEFYFSRYISLPASTLPASVRMYTVAGEIERWTALEPDGDKFKLYNQADGTLAVYLSDNTSWGQDYASDTQNWSIRFLDTTDISFEASSVRLPTGYTLLAYSNAVPNSLEFARQTFAKYYATSSTCTYTPELIRQVALSYPGVLDCSVVTSDNLYYDIYIKPIQDDVHVIFTELEDFLRNNLTTITCTTYCADYVKCMFIIKADISLSLRSQIETYLQETYAYNKMAFTDTITASEVRTDLDDKFDVSQFDPEFDVFIRIKHGIYKASWIDDPNDIGLTETYVPGSISIYDSGEQVGWDDATLRKIYCSSVSLSRDIAFVPHFVLASNTTFELNTSNTVGYDFRTHIANIKDANDTSSTNPLDVSTLYNHCIYLGGNCAYAYVDQGGRQGSGGILYIYPLNSDYFKNPGVTFNPLASEYAHPLDGTIADSFKYALDNARSGVPIVAYDGNNTAYFVVYHSSTQYADVIVLDLTQSTQVINLVHSVDFYCSDYITSINYYKSELYLASDDGTVYILSYLDSISWSREDPTYCRSFTLRDSQGNSFVNFDNVDWKFDNVANFSLYIAATGDIQVVMLDSADPGIDAPTEHLKNGDENVAYSSSSRSFGRNTLWQYDWMRDVDKRRCNSKWLVYSADRFKITSRGLELINLQKVNTIPSFIGESYIHGDYVPTTTGGVHRLFWEANGYYVPIFGPVATAGVDGSVFAYGQFACKCLYVGSATTTQGSTEGGYIPLIVIPRARAESGDTARAVQRPRRNNSSYVEFSHPTAYGCWVHDTTTGITSEPSVLIADDCIDTETSTEIPTVSKNSYVYQYLNEYDPAIYYGEYVSSTQPASVTLTMGFPIGKTFTAEMPRACALSDRYVKLDDYKYIVWVS